MANIKISELNPLLTVEDADVLPIVDNAVTKKVTAAILRSYTQGNSVLLTGAQTVAGIKTFTSQLASTVATGTAPFSVASTTKVTNLNADLLDGLSSADFQATLGGSGIVKSTAGTISYLTDNSANWNTAYNDKINSASVTGSGTNTLTLTQQDAGTITATWVNGTLIREIRNNTGATLTKGTIVYISGATGNKPTVTKAIATGDTSSAQTFGFVQENILNNANGYVVVVGDLTGVDTSAFAEGAQLYLSATTAGTFTDVKQYAPNHLVYVGIVTRAHPTLGQIEVNIQNGYELDELHNVAAQSPSNGDILQYVTSTGLWTKIGGTTSAISEGSNLYFTNARSRSAISLTTTGTSGAATYNSTTGVLNVPNYADGGITSLNGLTALTQTFAVGTSGTDFGISSATSTHTFNLPTASATNRGALSSADWTTFNNKQNALTNPITGTGTTNYLPKFTGASALGDSILSEASGGINIAQTGANYSAINTGTKSTFRLPAVTNVNLAIGVSGSGSLGSIIQSRDNVSAWYLSLNPFGGQIITANANDTGEHFIIGGTAKINGNLKVEGASPVFNINRTSGTTLGTNYSSNGTSVAETTINLSSGEFKTSSGFSGYGGFLTFNTDGVTRLTIASTGGATFSADATINGVTVGKGAGNVSTNTALGSGALNANTTGSTNTAIGFQAAVSNTTGSNITTIGFQSFPNNSTGVDNVGVGFRAGFLSETGSSNAVLGTTALYYNITGSNNTAIGSGALLSNLASNNTAVGYEAGFSTTSGTFMTALGYQALRSNTTGGGNSAIGNSALKNNTTGNENNAFGVNALNDNTTGSNNTAIGQYSLQSNSTGDNNTALGYNTSSGNYSGCTILGINAAATGNFQFVVGSSSVNAGSVATEVNASSKVWNVIINGVAQKILLA